MPVSYEDDPRMRRLAWEMLPQRVDWFEWLKMRDAERVVTMFLRDWRDAMYRHDTGRLTMWDWAAKVWGVEIRPRIQRMFPYLEE